MSDVDNSSIYEMLPPSVPPEVPAPPDLPGPPDLPAPPIQYTTHVQQPYQLPNHASHKQQLQQQTPYQSVPPVQMQPPYRLPTPFFQEQLVYYQYPYRHVPPAQMQQPYSPYHLPSKTSEFPYQYVTPTQMQQPYQWTSQNSQSRQPRPHSPYAPLLLQMPQHYQLPSQKLQEPQPLSHPLTTSKSNGTAPKPSQGGDLPEREASKLNATQATGRPYNHRLGMPLADS